MLLCRFLHNTAGVGFWTVTKCCRISFRTIIYIITGLCRTLPYCRFSYNSSNCSIYLPTAREDLSVSGRISSHASWRTPWSRSPPPCEASTPPQVRCWGSPHCGSDFLQPPSFPWCRKIILFRAVHSFLISNVVFLWDLQNKKKSSVCCLLAKSAPDRRSDVW